jgi:hypothetical protein
MISIQGENGRIWMLLDARPNSTTPPSRDARALSFSTSRVFPIPASPTSASAVPCPRHASPSASSN